MKGRQVKTRVWRMCAETWKREHFRGTQPAGSVSDKQRQHTLVQRVGQAAGLVGEGGSNDGAI